MSGSSSEESAHGMMADSIMRVKYYAHRGLYQNTAPYHAPENSLYAFRAAAARGYGIELDVRLTKDCQAVVFHDKSLARMCGVPGSVRDYTYEALSKLRLCGGSAQIPLLSQVLSEINGKVPLIIEIKAPLRSAETCCRIAEVLCPYDGPFCIESFHPSCLRWYRRHDPRILRGLLLKKGGFLRFLLSAPDFISYDIRSRKRTGRMPFSFHLIRWSSRLFRRPLRRRSVCPPDQPACTHPEAPVSVPHAKPEKKRSSVHNKIPAAAWTVQSQEALIQNQTDFDFYIFENFLP